MVVLSKPDPYPKELVQTLCEYFKTRTEVLSEMCIRDRNRKVPPCGPKCGNEGRHFL